MNVYLDSIEIPTTLALAIMATLGYVFGTLHQRRRTIPNDVLLRLQRDLSRSKMAVSELNAVICEIRSSTAKHCARFRKFQNRVARLDAQQGNGDAVWHELCREVECLVNPTLQLVGEIANAQERIRYQSNYLVNFSELRIDPLTGLGNRRALDHVLSAQLGVQKRYGTSLSLAIVDIDDFKALNDEQGHLYGDQALRDLAKLLTDAVRAVDVLARYGGDEFVAVMPQTDLVGAGALGERLRVRVEQQMPFTISVGVASASGVDTPESLFQRADLALYHAKSSGRNCTRCNPADTTETVLREAVTEAPQAVAEAPQEATCHSSG
jgi:diguanylate cyclase (GGDEF)-like protein